MFKIKIKTDQKAYPVYLGRGMIDSIGSVISAYLPACSILVVSDRNVSLYYGERCLESLRRAGFKPYLEVLEGGEKDKSLTAASTLYTRALEAGLDRHAAIVALGGGVTGDLAGFVAATYLRGVPYVQVPTTLLAMVDSSIGGKVAVNHPLGKNLIGAFYQPSLVISDVDTLNTLPEREFNAGLAELVKYGVIWDKKLFERLESLKSLSRRASPRGLLLEIDNPWLLKFIARAVLIKGEIVCRDEREKNLRRVLNFGHTFGHALEAATGYAYYLHGEAVACGMAMAARLAVLLNILDPASERRIKTLLKQLKTPFPPQGLNKDTVAEALFYDKKKEGGELVFVLPTAPGRVLMYKAPPFSLMEQVIEEYLRGDLL
ncbi:MAG: 3-dehydroquinate synthase [Dethiobacter sp.]|jgi:3-dehydroquinate synthase|nr:MAG: 3-dehydroquinate synthase [Dethiobacter sp.]